MKTVGQILKKEREKQGKSIFQIHRKTKISEKNLIALEIDDYSSLPAATFVKGFIQIYAKALYLNPEKLLAIFRRDSEKKKQGKVFPQELAPLSKRTFWTPKLAVALASGLFLAVFLTYLGLHLKSYFSPPALLVERPAENEQIEKKTAEVKGKTDEGASVYVNDELIDIDEKGAFSYQLKLFPGTNTITIKAIDRQNKETEIIRQIQVIDKNN
jgi:cytoskeletal protein RodZ